MDIVSQDQISNSGEFGVPYKGQLFNSLSAAGAFYYTYASKADFDVRKSSQKNYRNPMNGKFDLGLKVYVCSKQGRYMEKIDPESIKPANVNEEVVEKDGSQCEICGPFTPTRFQKSGIIRSDCKVAITLKKDFKLDKWLVHDFIELHNHPLTSPSKKHFLKINRKYNRK